MRQWIKSALRWLWRLTLPVRRPIYRKFDAYWVEQLQCQLKPLGQVIAQQSVELRELNLCAENTIRELVRLQAQLEAGQFPAADSFPPASGDWSVIAPDAASGSPARRHDLRGRQSSDVAGAA